MWLWGLLFQVFRPRYAKPWATVLVVANHRLIFCLKKSLAPKLCAPSALQRITGAKWQAQVETRVLSSGDATPAQSLQHRICAVPCPRSFLRGGFGYGPALIDTLSSVSLLLGCGGEKTLSVRNQRAFPGFESHWDVPSRVRRPAPVSSGNSAIRWSSKSSLRCSGQVQVELALQPAVSAPFLPLGV